jgi:hypothetical protein
VQRLAERRHSVARGQAEIAELLGGVLADVEIVVGKLPDEIGDGGEFLFLAGRWIDRSGNQDHPQRDETTHEETPVGAIFSSPRLLTQTRAANASKKN